MHFLRFSRDKRGYENTYLCHTYRYNGEVRLRVLYWFRTPPWVKVGRLALDSEAIRAIEESHPRLRFDWDTILKVKPPPPPSNLETDARMRRRRGRVEAVSSPGRTPARAPRGKQVETPELPKAATDVAAACEAGTEVTPVVGSVIDSTRVEERTSHVTEGLTDEHGLARLRARHVELQDRISQKVQDPDKLKRLRGEAARLDPDGWQTVEEARERLETLDQATTAIRSALGRPRRRRRGGTRHRRRPDGGDADVRSADSAASEGAVVESNTLDDGGGDT
jgi:hypothetical protein